MIRENQSWNTSGESKVLLIDFIFDINEFQASLDAEP